MDPTHQRSTPGVGCDQVLALQSSAAFSGDVFFLDIWNRDGSKAQACGNGTRCVMGWLMDTKKTGASLGS